MDISFLDFDVRSPLLSTDYIVGHKQDGSTEYRALISELLQVTKHELLFNESTKNLTLTKSNNVLLTSLASKPELIHLTWTPDTNANMLSGVDFAAPFDVLYNTNTNIFDLLNTGETDPAARVHIKEPGYYEFYYQVLALGFTNTSYTFKILKSDNPVQTLSADRVIGVKQFSSDSQSQEMSVEANSYVNIDTAGFYTVTITPASSQLQTNIDYNNENNIPTATLIIKKITNI